MNQLISGSGQILFEGREIDVDYEITVRRTPHLNSADGTVTGLNTKDHFDLLESANEMALRLNTGQEVKIIFLGGNLGDPLRIEVNSRMPGF